MTEPTKKPEATNPEATEEAPASCAGCAALDRKLHELALTLAQDGNLHGAGEDRLHKLFGDGFAEHFEYSRPARQPNESA